MSFQELHQALHAGEPRLPKANVATAAIEHISREKDLRVGVVVGELAHDMARASPDENVAAAQVERDSLFGVVGHAPEANHLFVSEAHVTGVGAIIELVDGRIVVVMEMAD